MNISGITRGYIMTPNKRKRKKRDYAWALSSSNRIDFGLKSTTSLPYVQISIPLIFVHRQKSSVIFSYFYSSSYMRPVLSDRQWSWFAFQCLSIFCYPFKQTCLVGYSLFFSVLLAFNMSRECQILQPLFSYYAS